jgi:hypothetical protein
MNDRRDLRERDHLEGLGVKDNIKMDTQEVSWGGMDGVAGA